MSKGNGFTLDMEHAPIVLPVPMTLRQYAAIQFAAAMAGGVIASSRTLELPIENAKGAVMLADVLLAELDKPLIAPAPGYVGKERSQS